MVRTKRSAKAFRLGERAGSRTGVTPAAASVSRTASVKSGSRSWMRNRLPRRKPSSASVALRASWVTHGPSGSAVMPAISTRRVANSISTRTR